jgi:hypothetical protein
MEPPFWSIIFHGNNNIADSTISGSGWLMVLNATFNNISVISWQSVLLAEKTGVFRENHRPVASHWQSLSHNESHRPVAIHWQFLSHNVVSSTPCHERGSNSQLYWWKALIAQILVNPTTIRSRPWRPPPESVIVLCNDILKESLNIDGQQFSQSEQNVRPSTDYLKYKCFFLSGWKLTNMPENSNFSHLNTNS